MTDRNRQPDNDLNLEDPLGIAQTPVARDAVNIARETDDEATVRRRRARAGLDGHDDRARPGEENTNPDGASGIDMGYGGDGTNVKP